MLPTTKLVFDRKGEIKKGGALGLLQVEVYDSASQRRKYFEVCRIAGSAWNVSQKKVVDKQLTALEIENIRLVRKKIDDLIFDCSRSGLVFSLEWLYTQYHGGFERNDFLAFYAAELDLMQCEPSTKGTYKMTLGHLRTHFKKLSFGGVTADGLVKFRLYLKTKEKPLMDSTIIKVLTNVKYIWGLAVKKRLFVPQINPFEGLELKMKPTDSVKYLEYDEFLKIEGLAVLLRQDGSSEKKPKLGKDAVTVVDMFLFSCYTGLRFSDVAQLTSAHFYTDKDGNMWINKVLQKTKRTGKALKFCLTDFLDNRALKMVKKYNVVPNVPLFKKVDNRRVNIVLTRVFKHFGISEELTYHSSRHTFAMLLYNESGLELSTVQYLLGHSNIKTTGVYARMKDTKIMNLTRGVTLGGPTAATETPITVNKPSGATSV